MIAGSADPLFADWNARVEDPNRLTARVARIVAARAVSLVEDWPIAAAMLRARLLGTHGARGLTFQSAYQADDEPDTTDAERKTRLQIESYLRRRRKTIDAGGRLSRRKLDRQLDAAAIVMGDGFAIRSAPDAETRWRFIHPFRVRNALGTCNDETHQDGIELDSLGRPIALIVDPTRCGDMFMPSTKFVRVPWTDPDGTPNVVHRRGWEIPGSIRGLSFFAPLMLPARMLQGVSEAYVAAKRVQASIPLLMEVEDVAKAREQYKGTRLANLLMGPKSKVEFPSWKFEGDDYSAFKDSEIRDICAAWGIPWELVLGDHSAKSGASSRSLWQQYYIQSEDWQIDHAEEVSAPIDESLLREGQARGEIEGLSDDWQRNMEGSYRGPSRVMPDPAKEADAAGKWAALHRSLSSIHAEQGWDFREEVMQEAQDEELLEAQDMADAAEPAEPAEPAELAPANPPPAEDPAKA